MTNKQSETDSCVMCNGAGCSGCNLSKELKNNFAPNRQTVCMVKDGYLTPEQMTLIHLATFEERAKSKNETAQAEQIARAIYS